MFCHTELTASSILATRLLKFSFVWYTSKVLVEFKASF
jgi:hypothetical protein